MANVLNTDKQIAIIGSLSEGSSIRSIERITGDPNQPFRPVTVLHIHPALTPIAAVRAFIVQEFRNAQTA